MDFLIKFLASLFAKFRLNNPAVAGVVLLVLSTAIVTINNGELFGVFPVTGLLKDVVQYISLFLTAVISGASLKEKASG